MRADAEAVRAEAEVLRATNTRLRRVIESLGERHAAELAAEREARRLVEVRVAELERRVGMDSGNSSVPPSREPIGAKARRKAARAVSQRQRSKDRKPGGQPGHGGAGLRPAEVPDRTEQADPPVECAACHEDLSTVPCPGEGWAQVWDTPPIRVETVHYRLPRRRCPACRTTVTASVPHPRAGSVVYGPNLNAAAWRRCWGRGFIARAHARLADRLETAGFDQAMRNALRAEPVLCADETPVNVLRKDTGADGTPLPGSPHMITVRSAGPGLVCYTPVHARSAEAIAALGVMDGYTGVLVRDDYAGWHQFDGQLAGVGQCGAHLIRHPQDVWELHPDWQKWARIVQDILREAHTAVAQTVAAGRDRLDPGLLADLRARYDTAVEWGRLTNRCRDWDGEGNHPGYTLARRLAAKAEQVWLFTRDFAVPWTNNAAEQALRGPKRHQAVSGYWHTPATLRRYCRVRPTWSAPATTASTRSTPSTTPSPATHGYPSR